MAINMTPANTEDFVQEPTKGFGDNFFGIDMPWWRDKRDRYNQTIKDLQYSDYLDNTKYQRMVADLKAAGINPAWFLSEGGASASMPSVVDRTSSDSSGNNNFVKILSMLFMFSTLFLK